MPFFIAALYLKLLCLISHCIQLFVLYMQHDCCVVVYWRLKWCRSEKKTKKKKKNRKYKSLVGINLVGTSFMVSRAFYLPANQQPKSIRKTTIKNIFEQKKNKKKNSKKVGNTNEEMQYVWYCSSTCNRKSI